MTFTHLHVHSHYSLLEAVPQIPDLVEKAIKLGFESLAITETNSLYSAIEFQKECKKKGLKSIIGCEISVAEKSMYEETNANTNRVFKLVLLCKNEFGYKNLIKLVSHAHILPKEKRNVCIDINELEKYSDGLVCLSGLSESFLWEKLRTQDLEAAKVFCEKMKDIFNKGESSDFYLEVGIADTAEGKIIRDYTVQLAKDLELKIVACSNAHYLNLGDKSAQKVLMGISNEMDGKEKFNRIFKNANFTLHALPEIEKY